MLISNMKFLMVSLRRVAPNTSEQRSRSRLCKRVIRREATETEGLVDIYRVIEYADSDYDTKKMSLYIFVVFCLHVTKVNKFQKL